MSSAMSITQLCNKEEELHEEQQQQQQQEHFIRRLPIVNTAIKAYENSSSSVAGMIESYAGPIYDKLGYERKMKQVKKYNNTIKTAY